MKKYFSLFPFLLVALAAVAQNSGKGFSYQAVARGTDGQIMASENIEIQFSLLPGAFATQAVWMEKQVATTDPFGVFTMNIGKGMKSGGTAAQYTDIDFSTAEFWLKVEMMDEGNFQEISKTQLLSVPYAEVAGNAQPAPTGSIMPFAGEADKIPNGWMLCDGTQLSRSEFAILYNIIGTAWGAGNGSTTFHLPDLRGVFLRGVSGSRNNRDEDRNNRPALNAGGNTNNNVGSFQSESFKRHNHSGRTSNNGAHRHNIKTTNDWQGQDGSVTEGDLESDLSYHRRTEVAGEHRHTIPDDGNNETRPDNVYVHYIIKL